MAVSKIREDSTDLLADSTHAICRTQYILWLSIVVSGGIHSRVVFDDGRLIILVVVWYRVSESSDNWEELGNLRVASAFARGSYDLSVTTSQHKSLVIRKPDSKLVWPTCQ